MARSTKNTNKKTNRSTKTNTTRSNQSKNSTNNNSTQQSTNNAYTAATNAFNNASAYTNPFSYGNTNATDYINNLMPQNLLNNFKTANTEQWMATTQKNIETSIAAGQQIMGSFKTIAERQAAFLSSFLQDNTSAIQEILTSNADPKQKLEETSEAVKDSMERLAANTRETMKYMEKTATDVGNLLNKRVSDCLDEIKDAA